MNSWRKRKRGVLVGKGGGPCTPLPTWRLGFSHNDATNSKDKRKEKDLNCSTEASARKLGVNLWEIRTAPLIKLIVE